MNKCAQCACLYVPDASERGAGREGVNPWLKAGSVSAKRRGHLPLSHPVRLGVARRLVNMVALANAAATLAVRPTAAPRHTRCVCAAACATARPFGCHMQGAATCCLLEAGKRGCSLQRSVSLTAAFALLLLPQLQRSAVRASRSRQLQRQRGAEGDRRRCEIHACARGLPKCRVPAGAAAECSLRTDPL